MLIILYNSYVYRYCDYTLKDANHGAPLEIGETAKVIMFRALPGRSFRVSNATPYVTMHSCTIHAFIDGWLYHSDLPPTAGYHSHSSPNYMEWYMFNDDQLLATYVLTVKVHSYIYHDPFTSTDSCHRPLSCDQWSMVNRQSKQVNRVTMIMVTKNDQSHQCHYISY